MQRVLMALIMACGVACFSDEMTGGSSTTGRYTLLTVNGARLPYTAGGTGTTKTELLDDEITLFIGGTYAASGHVRTTVNGQVATASTSQTGTYSLFGTSITLRTSDGALTRLAMVDGSRMTFVESGMTAVYSK